MKRDNSTYQKKVMLRRTMLELAEGMDLAPVVMETHGGMGKIFSACYRTVSDGVVIEKKPERAAFLARQRPAWFVYEADCVEALRAGVGGVLPVNVLDVDPYGDPWPTIEAFFGSDRDWPATMFVVVNDGLRQGIRMGRAWGVESLRGVVERYGNDLHDVYLDVCRELMSEKAGLAGYDVDRWAGYYCGHQDQMTHYLAVLTR